MSGAVVTDRHAVAAAEILRVEPDRVGGTVAVDLQFRSIDLVERVGFPVVVRVERLVCLPAPELGLLGGLVGLGAREDPTRRDPRTGEPVVVGSAIKRR